MMNLKRFEKLAKEIQANSWFPYLLLFLITVLAGGIRLYKLGSWSLWIDEIYTINHAMAHFSTPKLLFENIPPHRNWIPVSVILTAQTLNLSQISEWNARIVSALIGILSVPILYFPTKGLFGKRVAVLAALLLAITPWHIFWSQNARFYTSLMLFYSLALFAFHFGIEKNEPKYLFLFFLLVYLAASERLTALFVFPVVISYLLALKILKFEKPKGLNIRNIAIIIMPLALGSVVELYFRMVKGESRFFADFNWFMQYQIDDPFRLLVFIANNLGIPLMVMAIFSSIMIISKRNRAGLLIALSALGPLFMLVILNLFIFTKDRYIFITLFSWIILTTIGIIEIGSHLKGNRIWLVLGIFFVFFAHASNNLLLYYQVNHGNRIPWKSAFSIVTEQVENADVVVAYWPEFGTYYLQRKITPYSDLDVKTILESNKKYWFVLDSETIWNNGEAKSWIESNAELINVWYLRLPEDNSLRLYFFDPTRTH